jgi:hypothetical protein
VLGKTNRFQGGGFAHADFLSLRENGLGRLRHGSGAWSLFILHAHWCTRPWPTCIHLLPSRFPLLAWTITRRTLRCFRRNAYEDRWTK